MRVAECPHCKTSWLVDDEEGTRSSSSMQCKNCGGHFSTVPGRSTPVAAAAERLPETATVIKSLTQLPEGKRVALVAMTGPAKGAVFYLKKAVVEIGRAGTDIVIPDPEVSGRHCQIEVRGETAYLTDLGSTNGIVVDGNCVKSCHLRHLSEFAIGNSTLMFTVTREDSGT